MRDLRCGLLDESFGCGGPALASELGQSQLSDVLQRTRVQWELFDYSNRARTVSNPNLAHVTAMFQRYVFGTGAHLLTCPCNGLSLDTVALCLRLGHRKSDRMRVLRGAKREGRPQGTDRLPRRALLRDSQRLSVYTWARDDRAVHSPGRTPQASGQDCRGNDGSFSAHGVSAPRSLPSGWDQSGNEYR